MSRSAIIDTNVVQFHVNTPQEHRGFRFSFTYIRELIVSRKRFLSQLFPLFYVTCDIVFIMGAKNLAKSESFSVAL